MYEVGERFLPPSVRLQPLKAVKDAAANAVDRLSQSGYDDQLGVLGYSEAVNWLETLSTNYARARARIRGAAPFAGSRLDLGIQAAREELSSGRARPNAVQTIVLVIAGSTNSGLALAQAQAAADDGIVIHCIGVGPDVDHNLLDSIAAICHGKTIYIGLDQNSDQYGADLIEIFNRVSLDQVHTRLLNAD